MNHVLFLVCALIFTFGINYAYAEPLEVNATVLTSDDTSATIQLTWNLDTSVVKYEVGCVSCMPSVSIFSTSDSVMLYDVTTFPNTFKALLYVVAYDSHDEIVDAKQILLDVIK